MKRIVSFILVGALLAGCGKKGSDPQPPGPTPVNFTISSWTVNGIASQTIYYNVNRVPVVKFRFGTAIDRNTVTANIIFKENSGTPVNCTVSYENADSVVVLQPSSAVNYLAKYKVSVATSLKAKNGGSLITGTDLTLITSIDSSRKFPPLSDNALLDLVQQQTFKYFWDFGHPVSGLARERNTSGEIVTSGGSGFGIMALVAGISRGFKTRAEGLTRMQTIVGFLKNTAPVPR